MSSECEENSNKSIVGTKLELAWLVLLKVSCNRQLGKDHRPLFNIAIFSLNKIKPNEIYPSLIQMI